MFSYRLYVWNRSRPSWAASQARSHSSTVRLSPCAGLAAPASASATASLTWASFWVAA